MTFKNLALISLSVLGTLALLYGMDWLCNFMIGREMRSPRDYLITGVIISGVFFSLGVISSVLGLKPSSSIEAGTGKRVKKDLKYYILMMIGGLILMYGINWIAAIFIGLPRNNFTSDLIMHMLLIGVILYFSKYSDTST